MNGGVLATSDVVTAGIVVLSIALSLADETICSVSPTMAVGLGRNDSWKDDEMGDEMLG